MTNELLGRLDQGTARLFNATIAEEAGRWFVSFCCEVERSDAPARFPDEVVGVDLGVVHLASLSNGMVVDNPKLLNHYRRKMARLNRELSRRKIGSKRRELTKVQLARVHRKVRCLRADSLHQLTSSLAASYGTVVIEDLNVAGMTASPRPHPDPNRPGHHLRNGKAAKAGLNRAILDTAPGEFRRQLTYKLAWRGGTLVVADRWFPSSKLCSSCGSVIAKLSKPDLFHPMNDRAIAGAGNCWRPAAGSARHFHVILSGSPSSRPSAMSDITSNVG
jgi:putative transposase